MSTWRIRATTCRADGRRRRALRAWPGPPITSSNTSTSVPAWPASCPASTWCAGRRQLQGQAAACAPTVASSCSCQRHARAARAPGQARPSPVRERRSRRRPGRPAAWRPPGGPRRLHDHHGGQQLPVPAQRGRSRRGCRLGAILKSATLLNRHTACALDATSLDSATFPTL